MLPFSPLLVTTALVEGLRGFTSLLLQEDSKAIKAFSKIIFTEFDFLSDQKRKISSDEKNIFFDLYTEKKETLGELLRQADTGSLDYKRFSFIIQLLWDCISNSRLFFLNTVLYDGTRIFPSLLSMRQRTCT